MKKPRVLRLNAALKRLPRTMIEGQRRALIVGNSDGIGLATTRRLLGHGWAITGVSRSPSPIVDAGYHHQVVDVASREYRERLRELWTARGPFDVCIYCVGIGEPVRPEQLQTDIHVFEVNLMAALWTAQVLIPAMLSRGSGHLVVLSSQADELVVPEVPSYAASKAALSAYFEGLGLNLRRRGIAVTNVRFGFVDTKMARAGFRPFMYSVDKAAAILERVLETRPVRITRPVRTAALVCLGRWLTRWRVRLARC